MMILRGIAGNFDGVKYPRGALDEGSAIAYAARRGYVGRVLDVSGEAAPHSAQHIAALAVFRWDFFVEAIYGFSGGGYNVRHVLNSLTPAERIRLKLVVVLGAPHNPKSLYQGYVGGNYELVYRLDPPEGHMAGPRKLLDELDAPQV